MAIEQTCQPFDYVCKHYGVPACIGRRVTIDGKGGVIVEDRGHYIGVNFDDDKPGVIRNCHPTWQAEYGGMGKVRKLTRSQLRYRQYLDDDCGSFDNFRHFLQWHGGK